MVVLWLVEADVFPATAPRIIAALEEGGYPWTKYEDGIAGSALPPADTCLIFWGSLGAAYDERSLPAGRPALLATRTVSAAASTTRTSDRSSPTTTACSPPCEHSSTTRQSR
jgi:hypothetical protein